LFYYNTENSVKLNKGINEKCKTPYLGDYP